MTFYAALALFFYSIALVSPYGSCDQAIAANVSSPCDSSETECGFGCCPFAEAECCADGLSCCENGQTCIPTVGTCIGISSVDGQPTLSSTNVSSRCDSSETECGFGCCPFAEAECCADGLSCCENGQTCIPTVGTCIGISSVDGQPTLSSSQSVPVKSSVFICPSGTTDCGKDKCCRYPHATCCSDGLHCCPQGYSCDLAKKSCVKSSNNMLSGWPRRKSVSATKTVEKSPFKSCPASGRTCPSYMSCCINNAEEWGCCPNPALPQIRYGNGECCNTIFGYMCCPDDYPVCTIFGCTKR